ncbi:MAG: glycosyltransferase [Deltaproteobacteria bacterium]|jgi:glycosyltransferase involved in cell wall biosynthesis|nr:glycosyltransferase [Deltaproteobacteria bacterium]
MLTFAIAIPNYNQSHFLPWALEGLRHQSVPFNVALMDGGSSDDFKTVAAFYSDVIDHLESGPDGGQAAAIKKGKARVPGDIVAWLNADDYYFPGTLDRVSSVFEKNPDVDVVYGDAVHVTAEGCFLSYFPPVQSFNPRDLARSCFICQPTCFVRRKVYERVGGIDATLKYTMDWDLWHRLSRAGAKFQYIHEVLAAVRYYPGTKTMSGDRRRYREIWRIERKYGRRLMPFSWAGFYRYDLSFKEQRNLFESFLLSVLDRLRKSKKRVLRRQGSGNHMNRILYGFRRWEPVVETNCVIHLPWYDRQQWQRLCLQVEPFDEAYIIEINDERCDYTTSETGRLMIDVPHITAPYRKISISRSEGSVWRLLDFHYELIDLV